MITLSFVLLILGMGLLLFMPFLRHAPGKDESVYFLIGRNAEKIYSDEARSAYWRYYISTTGSALAFVSAIEFFGFGCAKKYQMK